MDQIRINYLKMSALLIVGLLLLGCIPMVALGGSNIGSRAGVPVVVQNSTTANPSVIIPGQITHISTPFTHADMLAPNVFNITFKVMKDCNNGPVVPLVINHTSNWNPKVLNVTQNQAHKTNYTATVNWTTPVDQPLGTYFLYFYVNDTKNHAEDACVNNPHKLMIIAAPAIPTIVPGSTNANPKIIQAAGNYATVLSVYFNDSDHPSVDSFKMTFKVRDQGNNEVSIVNSVKNGFSGVQVKTIGSGASMVYYANVSWDPNGGQTIGSYCLYSKVEDSNGIAAVDDFSSNCNKLTLTKPSAAPVLQPGITKAQPSYINRSTETTTIYADFSHADLPPITDFSVTFKVRSNDTGTVYTLANNQQNGYGNVSIIYLGQGNYRASLPWTPNVKQPVGKYDLFFSVTDAHGHIATDIFDSNLKELTITKKPARPVIAAGVTTATPNQVNVLANGTTVLSTKFSDPDILTIDKFKVTFKVRDVGNVEYPLVDAQTNGNSGLIVTSDSKGNYTAEFTWKPSQSQALSCYALYSAVEDPNVVKVADDFDNNLCKLTLKKEVVSGNGTVQGVVKDIEGKAISGATVAVIDANNKQIKSTITTGDGSYTISVPIGSYTVAAQAPKYFSANVTGVKVTKGQTTTVKTLNLVQTSGGGTQKRIEVVPNYIFGLIVLLVVIIVILCLLLVMGMGKEASGSGGKGPRGPTHRHELDEDDVEPDHPIEPREEKEIENEPKPIPKSRIKIEKIKDDEPEEEEEKEEKED